MYWNNKVLWSEGMFLRTQHFQQFERYLERLNESTARWLHPFGWGFARLEIDEGLLRTGSLALARAAGILPDGTVFDAPHADDHPRPLDVPGGFLNTEPHEGMSRGCFVRRVLFAAFTRSRTSADGMSGHESPTRVMMPGCQPSQWR